MAADPLHPIKDGAGKGIKGKPLVSIICGALPLHPAIVSAPAPGYAGFPPCQG